MTMQLIETKTLGTAAATLSFTSIPQDGTDLVLVVSSRSASTSSTGFDLGITINSISSGYTGRRLYGTGDGTTGSDSHSTSSWNVPIPTSTSVMTANTFGSFSMYLPNYTSTSNKSCSSDGVSENNAARAIQVLFAGLVTTSEAITSITIQGSGQDIVAGSSASLYKITRGTSNGVVVS